MIAYRDALQTAKLELRKTYYEGRGSNQGKPRTVYESVTIAGEHHLHVLHGDDQGIVVQVEGGGGPAPAGGRSPLLRLESPTESWRRSEAFLVADRLSHPARQSDDLRTLGVAAAFTKGDIHDLVWGDRSTAPLVREYDEWDEGDLHVVRARSADRTRTYWLDPARAYSPVRVRSEDSHGNWAESRTVLQRMDNTWFPASVHCFSSQHKEGREPTFVVEVDSAEFNRPDHPTTLTPADIGIDVGIYVSDHGTRPSTRGRWDGEKIVPDAEYVRRLIAGEIQEGENFKRLFWRSAPRQDSAPGAASDGPGEPGLRRPPRAEPKTPESDWEAYVRRFIEKYKLDAAQAEKAHAILKSCQEHADKYVASKKSALEKLDEQAAALRDSDAQDGDAQAARIAERRRELRKPIDEIFEKQLKPRLDKLPTRAQRKAVEDAEQQRQKSRPAAQPATQPAPAAGKKP